MSDKIFAGTGKIIETKYGIMPKISFHKDHINTLVQYMKDNNLEWINLDMKEKKEKAEGKPTHYLEVNDYKPDAPVVNTPVASESSDLPF